MHYISSLWHTNSWVSGVDCDTLSAFFVLRFTFWLGRPQEEMGEGLFKKSGSSLGWFMCSCIVCHVLHLFHPVWAFSLYIFGQCASKVNFSCTISLFCFPLCWHLSFHFRSRWWTYQDMILFIWVSITVGMSVFNCAFYDPVNSVFYCLLVSFSWLFSILSGIILWTNEVVSHSLTTIFFMSSFWIAIIWHIHLL